jgi:hypothetical protein
VRAGAYDLMSHGLPFVTLLTRAGRKSAEKASVLEGKSMRIFLDSGLAAAAETFARRRDYVLTATPCRSVAGTSGAPLSRRFVCKSCWARN